MTRVPVFSVTYWPTVWGIGTVSRGHRGTSIGKIHAGVFGVRFPQIRKQIFQKPR